MWVEFDWGTDIYVARQIVNEKLQVVRGALPEGVDAPVLAPITSIMGEIMLVGTDGGRDPTPMELRTLADLRCQADPARVPGVSQVSRSAAAKRSSIRCCVDPYKVASRGLTLNRSPRRSRRGQQQRHRRRASSNAGQEYLIRGLGRVRDVEDIERTVVAVQDQVPVRVEDLAEAWIGARLQARRRPHRQPGRAFCWWSPSSPRRTRSG